jgi:uncharacterized phiE125 gp8 family phage protein
MNLTEETQVPEAALPVDALKAHLRMGSGFSEDAVQDGVIASFLQAALAAIEGRTGKALISRDFLYVLNVWRTSEAQVLPLAPVSAVTRVDLLDSAGIASEADTLSYRLEQDETVPRIVPVTGCLPSPATGGRIEVRFVAGFGAFADVPSDLKQAVLLLAAHYYEYRDETSLAEGCMPFGVTSLIARYRQIRLGFAQ